MLVAEQVGWVTGEDSLNRTEHRFGIHATDLGILSDDARPLPTATWMLVVARTPPEKAISIHVVIRGQSVEQEAAASSGSRG